jgi:hypothetical protein
MKPRLPEAAASAIASLQALIPARYSEEESLSIRRLQTYLRGFMKGTAVGGKGRPKLPTSEIVLRAVERGAELGTFFPRSVAQTAAARSRNREEVSEEIDRLIFLGVVTEVSGQLCMTPDQLTEYNNSKESE